MTGTTTFIVYIYELHVSTYTQVIFGPSCTVHSFYGLTCTGGPEDDLCIG
jgi:hypothetical protein